MSPYAIRCGRCRRELELDDVAGRGDPEGRGRLLCKSCWALLTLKPERRRAVVVGEPDIGPDEDELDVTDDGQV